MSDATAWVSAGAAVVSTGAAVWAILTSRRARKEAAHAERRSRVAGEEAATAKDRAVEAHEKAAQAQQEAAEIEAVREKDRRTEQSKAYLVARVKNDPIDRTARRINQFHLVVENKGRAEARSVVLTMDGKKLGEGITVGPLTEYDHKLNITREEHKQHEVVLCWEDDSGDPGNYRTTLML